MSQPEARRRRRSREPRREEPRSPQQLVEDTVGEIVLRLPPDDPALLVRASAVNKTWRRAVAEPSFPASYRAFHKKPPVLGIFRTDAILIPTTSFCPAAAGYRDCQVLDCRHGRVLLENLDCGDIDVWNPITGDQYTLPEAPEDISLVCNGAVLCAAADDDCDHLACHTGPFLVALVGASAEGQIHACLYSSESGEWSGLTSIDLDYIAPDHFTTTCITVDVVPAALMENALYFIGDFGNEILKYEFDPEEPSLTAIDPPPGVETCCDGVVVMPEADGRLGFAYVEAHRLHMWSMQAGPDGNPQWEKRRVIPLELLLPPIRRASPYLTGFVHAINCIVVTTEDEVYTIELKSYKTRKICNKDMSYSGFLFTAFCIPDFAFVPPPPPGPPPPPPPAANED
ncbi:hypothetical protein SETIT_2G019900v2 [Setaria italica]|uniref:F-box domain-containing protein n=1 Tax=Setaria italica TaxID=4555 RepID=A0A368PUL0_SETIT|nr:uncharacterized protein LOC105913878 [Setaria italica]RCV09342.1 hypothetical protein SETIT_2G019900v2 [Setaria italica]